MNVIPQLFYDLIARVIPVIGIMFLFLFIFIPNIQIEGFKELCDQYIDFVTFWIMLLLLSIVYIIAIVLKTPAEVLSEGKFIRSLFLDKSTPVTEGKLSVEEASKKFSTIRYKIPEEGFRLLKMLAEVRLCQMLIFGLFLALVMNLLVLGFQQKFLIYRVILFIIYLLAIKSLLSLKKSIKNGFTSSIQSISEREKF